MKPKSETASEELEEYGEEERACAMELRNLLKCFLQDISAENYKELMVSDMDTAHSNEDRDMGGFTEQVGGVLRRRPSLGLLDGWVST